MAGAGFGRCKAILFDFGGTLDSDGVFTEMRYFGSDTIGVFGASSLQGSLQAPPMWVLTGTAVAVVPEPETYAMLLAGLGLIGFVVRRRV